MGDQNSSEWDRILSQRLSRESQSFPAAKPEDAEAQNPPAEPAPAAPVTPAVPPSPTDGTAAFDSSAVAGAAGNLREIGVEGSVHPAPFAPPSASGPPRAPAAPPASAGQPGPLGQPGLPRGYGGITLGWAIGDNVAAVTEHQAKKQELHTTLKTREGLWSVGPGTAAAREVSDPKMVVDELRKLTPQEEQRAFDILKGRGRGGRKLVVAGIGLVVAVASAGLAILVHARVVGEKELQLVAALAPPEERVTQPPAPEQPDKPSPDESVAKGTTPEKPPGPGPAETTPPVREDGVADPPEAKSEIDTKPPEDEPEIVRVDERLAANDGPTFAVVAAPSKREWVEIADPNIDFADAPTVVEGDRPSP